MRGTSALVALLVTPCLLVAQVPMQDDSSHAEGDSLQVRLSLPAWPFSDLGKNTVLSLPVRGIENYLSLVPGVVAQNGELHVRGSRNYETSYLLDGINVTNAFFNSNGVPLIPEAMERLDVHTGAYGAALGSATGGIVAMTMREGGERLEASGDFRTDDFLKSGNQLLNTSSYGYRNAVVTVGGPLPFGVKFFAAGEHHFERDRQPMFLEPFRYDSLTTDINDARGPGVLLPGPIEFKRNYLYNNWLERNTVQANATWGTDVVRLKILASYSDERMPIGNDWPSALQNFYREERNFIDKTWTQFAALQFEHHLSPELSYRASFSWYRRYERTVDPVFGNSWKLYADSAANAQRGYPGFSGRYQGPFWFSTIDAFRIADPDMANNTYQKNRQAEWKGTVDVEYKPSPWWTINGGLSHERWTIRSFSVGRISGYLQYLYGYDGLSPRTIPSEYQKRYELQRTAMIANYGYTYSGSLTDSGLDAPREPMFFSSYAQTRFKAEFVDLTAGLRYEVFDTRTRVPQDPLRPFGTSNYSNYMIDGVWYDGIDPYLMKDKEPSGLLLPRLSLRVGTATDIHGFISFGSYAHIPPLNLIYRSTGQNDRVVSSYTRGNAQFSAYDLPAFFVEPERMNQFEVGIEKTIAKIGNVGLRAYRKDWSNQVQFGWADTGTFNDAGHYMVLRNEGSSQSKGVEFSAAVHAGDRFFLLVGYSLAEAKGLTSGPSSNAGYENVYGWSESPTEPDYMTYHEYNQTHRGTVMATVAGLPEDGAILNGTRLVALLTFNSGHSYTATTLRYLGSSTLWDVGVWSLIDPRSLEVNRDGVPGSWTTPWVTNLDLALSKAFDFDFLTATVYLHILNVFNTKSILNVYPATGVPNDDGWLATPAAQPFLQSTSPYRNTPSYEDFYRTINLENRWAYMGATGHDIYGTPRQVRLGVKVEY